MITIIKNYFFYRTCGKETGTKRCRNNQITIWHPINKFIKRKGDFNYDKMGM